MGDREAAPASLGGGRWTSSAGARGLVLILGRGTDRLDPARAARRPGAPGRRAAAARPRSLPPSSCFVVVAGAVRRGESTEPWVQVGAVGWRASRSASARGSDAVGARGRGDRAG